MNGQSLKNKLQSYRVQLAYVPQTFRLIFVAAPGWTLAWAILLVIQGLLPAASIYLTRLLVDSLVAALGKGVAWQTIQPTIVLGGLAATVLMLTQIVQMALEWVRLGQSEYVGDYLARLVHEKAIAADLAHYENPEYHDRLFQASTDLKTRPLSLLQSSGDFVQSCITLLIVAALLLPYSLWLPLLLLFSTLPALIVMLRFNRIYHTWWQAATMDRRWAHYYDSMLTHDFVAAEVRLFNLGKLFSSQYQRVRRLLRTAKMRLTMQRSLASLGATLFASLMIGMATVWMVWRAFLGIVTLGDVALFYQALNKSQGLLRNLLSSLGQINDNLLFLGNLLAFLNLEPQIVDSSAPVPVPDRVRKGIHLRQITFRYPGSHEPVFDDFDFFIPAGQIVAIVGANGAGKSTLVKLLCRLYDPEAGSIELDGIEITNFRVSEYRRMITGMFQLPVHYFSTAKENIALGDGAAHPLRERVETICMDDIKQAARRAGAHEFIARLPNGYDTLLGKYFPQGVELSGGEWQRLALARSFFRQAPIMILDEPTSFLDSWSENDWFARLRELAIERTTILITHRLTIAKQADIIHVMDKGRIVESGTHEELLAQDGQYARSWRTQMQHGAIERDGTQNGQMAPAVVY